MYKNHEEREALEKRKLEKREKIKSQFTPSEHTKNKAKRSVKYGSNSIILSIAFVAIIVAINLILGYVKLSFDLTPNALYSLRDENIVFLNGIKDEGKEIEIIGLFDETNLPDVDYKAVMRLLDEYDAFANITVSYVDPDKNPGYITNHVDPEGVLGALNIGDFVVISENKRQIVSSSAVFYRDEDVNGTVFNYAMRAEDSISGAINYVVSDFSPVIYFLTGHSEINFARDFSAPTSGLMLNNFSVRELDLKTTAGVPDDAVIVLMAMPQQDLSDSEYIQLSDYASKGGNFMIFAGAITSKVEKFTNLEKLINKYLISLNNDVVGESSEFASTQSSYTFYGIPYSDDDSVINAGLNSAGNMQLYMSNCRSLNKLMDTEDYHKIEILMQSSDASWSENVADGTTLNGIKYLAIASEYASSKMAVFGTASFIWDGLSEQAASTWANGYGFFTNVLNWMYENEDVLKISPKLMNSQKITVSENAALIWLVILVIVIPLTIMIIGFVVWLLRRHK